MPKLQRIRDPVHDLIEFNASDFEQSMWSLVNSSEFQRMRRIKQLGFSELVYPGATHTRFAHSIGVFHNARELSDRVSVLIGGGWSKDRAQVAMAAALVHDLGHGPFSHAFEEAIKLIEKDKKIKTKKHELWTSEIVRGDTEVGQVFLGEFGKEFREDVAELLTAEPKDIYASIVSSQFDADRLDYLRRDRLMTGAQCGSFDYSWILANLEVGEITLSLDGQSYTEVQSLILGSKAAEAAEAYVLGLFQMYFAVYFHKATRSAEKMLAAILARVGKLCEAGQWEDVGLPEAHPLVAFLRTRSLKSYLALDDFVVWASLGMVASGKDAACAELSRRLLNRQLYKACDVGVAFAAREDLTVKFKASLRRAINEGQFGDDEVFEDEPSRDPYKRRGYDGVEALQKVHIRRSDGGSYEDLATRSKVVESLQKKTIYRVFVKNDEARQKVEKIMEGVRSGH